MDGTALLFKIINPIMKAILRSPLHSLLSSRIMIIAFTGRRTGRTYATPVSYVRKDQSVTCFTHSSWWKNIGDGATVEARIGGRDFEGHGTAIPDDAERKNEALFELLKAVPSDAVFYGVKLDEDKEPIRADIERAAREAVMIRIQLRE